MFNVIVHHPYIAFFFQELCQVALLIHVTPSSDVQCDCTAGSDKKVTPSSDVLCPCQQKPFNNFLCPCHSKTPLTISCVHVTAKLLLQLLPGFTSVGLKRGVLRPH